MGKERNKEIRPEAWIKQTLPRREAWVGATIKEGLKRRASLPLLPACSSPPNQPYSPLLPACLSPQGHIGTVTSLAIIENEGTGHHLVSGRADGRVGFWDISTMELISMQSAVSVMIVGFRGGGRG